MDPDDDPYQLLFQENMDEYTSDDDNEIANFYLQTSPSINYYTFQQTSPQNNEQQPHPSQTINPGPSNLVPTAYISDIDFLDDDFELEVQSQDSQLNRILQEIDDDLKDESTTDFNPLNSINPLTNIQTDQTINKQNLADIPTSIPTMQNNFKSRFIINNKEERKSFLDDRENQNTKRKMMYSVITFKQFLNDIKSETRDIYTIRHIFARIFHWNQETNKK
ncbi:unnamed protein product [Mytilus coruscus]|uniref:Uncharacterized protein n=1 Tax=Mytilus coruscus TaxID=42192 RepID=A0A6J8AM58_MYTCO|nr:unnamed protein product [Mytilus coruscus]